MSDEMASTSSPPSADTEASQQPPSSATGNDLNNIKCEDMFCKLKDAIEKLDKNEIITLLDSFDKMCVFLRTEALKYAIKFNFFPMVEILYNYWSGDWHWVGHDINKLRMLGQLLEDARVACDVKNQQLLIDIHSLIKFNDFQQKLYNKISNLSDTIPMILEVLHFYDIYSDLEKVRIPQEDEEKEQMFKADFEEKSSEYMKAHAYVMYEVYFHKLDFHVALLIFENLYVIRQHLKKKHLVSQKAKSYKDIECAIYYFMYRTCDDWRLYLPRNRQLVTETHPGIDKDMIIDIVTTYDEHKLKNAMLLYLERKSFYENIEKLKIILEKFNSPGKKGQSSENIINLIDENYQTPTFLSDYYSLSKIVYYLQALESTNDNNVLMAERVLQVTGEMIKSSPETNHLLASTKSLLQIGIPSETVIYLQKIREFFSHVRKGLIKRRINIAHNHPQIFVNVKEDLKIIKRIIQPVLDLYKHILDKLFLENGLRLLEDRIKNLPAEASQNLDLIHRSFKEHHNGTESLFQKLRTSTGLTTQLLKEIIRLLEITDDISSKIIAFESKIDKQVVRLLPNYTQNMRRTLQLITDNQSNVKQLNLQLLKYNKIKTLPVNPKSEDIDVLKKKLFSIVKKNKNINVDPLLQSLKNIKDFSRRWEAIHIVLSFFPNTGKVFAPVAPKPDLPEDFDITAIENKLSQLEKTNGITSSCNNVEHSFGGIKELYDKIKLSRSTRPDISAAREELILCLISRVDLLKVTLQYPQHLCVISNTPSNELLRRYKDDLEFRFVFEMILSDIANILVDCGIDKLMNKSSKLLREINLRNVLEHGNPILEVLGDFFDCNDLPTGLLSKAIMFAKDRESIDALHTLMFKHKLDYNTFVKENLGEMNEEQIKHFKQFQQSPNWEYYKKLIPDPSKPAVGK